MNEKLSFARCPASVRYGIALQLGSWVFFIGSQVIYHGTLSLVHLTLAFACGVALYALKPWARFFCIAVNAFVLAALLPGLADGLDPVTLVIRLTSMILFAATEICLLLPASARFFAADHSATTDR